MNKSVQTITFFVPYGWLICGLHYWAAQALGLINISLGLPGLMGLGVLFKYLGYQPSPPDKRVSSLNH